MEKLKIGVIVNSFGIKGECKVKSFTDFIDERFAPGAQVLLDLNDETITLSIQSAKEHKGMVLLQFTDYSNINDIEKFKGCELYIDKSEIHTLNEGEFYFFELKNMKVVDEQGEEIGVVLQVEEGLAHNLLRVEKKDGTTCLVPYHPRFIVRVDRVKRLIVIRVIEGLL